MNRENWVCGYTRVGVEQGDESFDAGFSLYASVWPLLETYPGHKFQSGLFGTWMFAKSEDPKIEDVWFYSDIEGGLGWWCDTEYPTETPKFIMGAVAQGFSAWANGPGAGKGRDWDNPKGHYGIAQLSPHLLWPPDGLNLKQGTCADLLGYGYMPLPLTTPQDVTDGVPVPTGNQCWTLFLQASNFMGPATFVLPYFFSKPSVDKPPLAGKFLDSSPSKQNRHHAMETQYLPWAQAEDSNGVVYGRLAATFFPAGNGAAPAALHQITTYNRDAMWNRVEKWFAGDEPAASRIPQEAAHVHAFTTELGVRWTVSAPGMSREEREPIDAAAFIKPDVRDPISLAYAAQSPLVTEVEGSNGRLMKLPAFYRRVLDDGAERARWVAVPAAEVPKETGLHTVDFDRPTEPEPQTYTTPDSPDSCWKRPGPVSGPCTALPADGSRVTYFWYRFCDQPAVVQAGFREEEREQLQGKIEQLHRHWRPDQEYLAPPATGTLAAIDPALVVIPPKGMEVGYVPIVTRQEPAE